MPIDNLKWRYLRGASAFDQSDCELLTIYVGSAILEKQAHFVCQKIAFFIFSVFSSISFLLLDVWVNVWNTKHFLFFFVYCKSDQPSMWVSFDFELDAMLICCVLTSAVVLVMQRHSVFFCCFFSLLYQQVISMLVWPAGDSASKPNTSICCPLLHLHHLLLCYYHVLRSQHSEVYSFHFTWGFHLVLFPFGGVSESGKRTVFTVIYVHFGMSTSLRIFNSCQKQLNVIRRKRLNKKH